MDRRLVFVELDENDRRMALHDRRVFDSVLSDKSSWFFPEDVGTPVSEHAYGVKLTACCLTEETGASEAEQAVIAWI